MLWMQADLEVDFLLDSWIAMYVEEPLQVD
jgi:hypothetical protein